LEGVEVNGEEGAVVARAQGVNYAYYFSRWRSVREDFHGPVFVVSDAEAVEEFTQKALVCADEPDLENMGRGFLVDALAELFDKPGMLFGSGFFLDENGAEFPRLGEGFNRGLVKGLLVFVQKGEDALGGWRGHFGENLVGFKHTFGRVG